METTLLVIKIIHIAAGCLALLSGLVAILFRKKIKTHRPFGRFYFWCMTVIFISSLIMASYRFNLFLLFIGIFTYHAALTALRSLKLKQLHQGQKPETKDWLIEGLNILANIGLFVFGIYSSFNNSLQGGIVAMAFGLIGLRNSQSNIKRLRGKVSYKNHWLVAHIGGMLGSYIGAITAFTVNNNRWMGLPDVVAWLGPTLVLVPFIIYETRRVTGPKTLAV